MSDKNTIPYEIREYLEGIVQDAQLLIPSDEMKEEIIAELYARLDSYLTAQIVEHLPAEYFDSFIKLIDEKRPQDEIEQFLREKIPNVDDVFTQAFADFRELYLTNQALGKYYAASERTISSEEKK